MNSPLDSLAPGSLLKDRYRIERRIGQGGYGDVVAAIDTHTGRAVAIKILHGEALGNDPRALARMRQEAEILRAIQHPNIVHIEGQESSEAGEFLVMELLEGKSIQELVETEGPADAERSVEWVAQILSALAAAHRRQVLHRDIKPDNILLCRGEDGREVIKLLDFGVAKAGEILSDEPDDGITLVKTRVGSFVGTPRYASPELVVGDPIGPASDLFSVGLVVAEWLTGTPRITGERYGDVMAQLIVPTPFDLSDCPPRWQPWLERMLEKDPRRRFGTADEALDALHALVGAPEQQAAETSTYVRPVMGASDALDVAETLRAPIPALRLDALPTGRAPGATFAPAATEISDISLDIDYEALASPPATQPAPHGPVHGAELRPNPHRGIQPPLDAGHGSDAGGLAGRLSFRWAAFLVLGGLGAFLVLFIAYRFVAP